MGSAKRGKRLWGGLMLLLLGPQGGWSAWLLGAVSPGTVRPEAPERPGGRVCSPPESSRGGGAEKHHRSS